MTWNAKIIGDKQLQARLKDIDKSLLTRQIMGKIALDAVTQIKDRTLAGKDSKGLGFTPYSGLYLAYKKERGGKYFGNKVDLFNDGNMFGSMQPVTVTDRTAIIGFTKPKEALKASGHQEGSRRLPRRKFFGMDNAGRARAVDLLNDHLRKVLAR